MTTSAQSLDRPRGGLQILADLSLRIKLILVFLVVTLLAVGIISFLNIRSTSAALSAQVGEGMSALAEAEAHAVGSILARRAGSMQAWNLDPEAQIGLAAQNAAYSGGNEAIQAELANLDKQWAAASDDDPLIQERLGNELSRELAEYIRTVPDFAEAFLTDRYGGLVAASDRTSDYYQADEGWWQAAFNNGQGAVYIGRPEFDESAGVLGINMAVPLYAPNSNDVIGILRTTLDVTQLAGEFGQIGETGEVDLIFPGGDILSGYAGHEQVHEALDPTTMARLESIPHGYTEAVWDGIPNLVGFADVVSLTGEEFVSDLGWKVVAHQSQEEAMAAVTAQTRNTGSLTLITAIIVVVVAVGMGQVLANPIARLTGVVTRFTEGDLSARVDIDSRDETGVLAASFNQMAEQVGNLLTDVQAYSTALEERTRELEASQGVTFAASERTSPEELLGLVVDLVRDQFDLYHVQMYMVDEKEQAAVLRESTGYAGSQLLQDGHQIPLDQTALVTKAIREKEPVLVDDTNQDPNFMPNPLLPETQTELVVPLRVGERVLGALDIQDRTPGRFSEGTIALFQAMTDQVAFLFENNELLERVTDQTESLTIFTTQLRTASDIAEQLSTILDPEQMLHEMAELMQSRFGLYHVHIYVLDEAKRKLVVHAGSGETGQVLSERGHSIPIDAEKSLVARAARSGKPVLIKDTSLESDFMPNPLLPQTRSELSVPLVVGEQVLGVLDIQDDQADRFAESDVDTFNTLAGLAASSLQNANLFKQVETHAREAEMRYGISQALAGAQGEEEVLDVLLEKAGIYPDSMAAFNLFLPEEEELVFVIRKASAFESGLPVPPVGQIFKASEFPLINYLTPEEPFVCNNLATDERIDRTAQEFFKTLEMGSTIAVPITAGGEWLGYVGVGSKQEDYFDEEKIRLYQTLAEQGAVALRAARLFTQTQDLLAEVDQIFNSAGDGMRVVDKDFNTLRFNAAFAAMAGMSKEQAAGVKCYEALGGSLCHTPGCPLVQVLGGEERLEAEVDKERADGTTFPCHVMATPFKTLEGEVIGIVEVFRDITERKEAEQEREHFTTQLRIAADLAGQMNTILDPDQLLHEVVTQLQDRFDLYHVHVYLLDAETSDLVMRAGSGEVGQTMLEQGHKIPLDSKQSVVAHAGRGREIASVEDTSTAPDFMANPLLPDTRSEVAVPLVASDRLLGVLDVQDNQPGRFTQSDLYVFATVAGQIATSLQNAGYVEQVEAQLKVSQALAGAQTEEETLDAMAQVADFYPQAQVSIMMIDPGEEELTVIMRRSETFDSGLAPAGPVGTRFTVSQFTMLELISPDTPFVSNNSLTDKRIDPTSRAVGEKMGSHSIAILPITAGDEWLGVITATSPEEGYFDRRKLYLYQALAEQGAVALRTARLRDELQESLARFNGFSETTDYGFGIADLEGNITFVNPALLRLLGEESTEAVLGKKLFEYYPPEKVEVLNNTVLPSLTEEGKWTGELELLSVDGRRIPTEESLFVIRDEHGNPRYIADIITDITERKQVEEAIKESEERFRGLYEASPLGIILNDYESGDYLEANQAFVDMIGYSIEELNQLSYWDLTPKKYEPDEQEQIRSMEETGRYGPYQKEYIRKDGVHIPVVLNGVQVTDTKGRKLIWSTVADITYQVQREEVLPEIAK